MQPGADPVCALRPVRVVWSGFVPGRSRRARWACTAVGGLLAARRLAKWPQLTRLETRTKECYKAASVWVENPEFWAAAGLFRWRPDGKRGMKVKACSGAARWERASSGLYWAAVHH